MAEVAFGTKRTCAGCGTRFYDLGKQGPTCWNCGTVFEMTQYVVRSKKARGSALTSKPSAAEEDPFLSNANLDHELDTAFLNSHNDQEGYE
jgi:hypothetical protein